ncbi:MAG: YdiU family protein [Planctomycetota bacterium]
MTTKTQDRPLFPFDNTFAREMEGFYVAARTAPARSPRLVAFNRELAEELGLDADALDSDVGARIFGGAELPDGATPIAQAYAGHQFGHFVPQLGDGRALLLGEVVDRNGRRRDVQLKGSGPTHFSRGGDGLAALGPVLREYLVGEAMHALGVPTTRALAATLTGELVQRDTVLPGAVLTRVAASHLRVGTFQFFMARGDVERVRKLADHAIARHFPELVGADDRYLRLLEGVRDRQAALVAKWMQIGFVHGVMNTDNTSISGETIDYGPCAFMDRHDPATVFSSIDRNGRYAYGNQPYVAAWNLSRFAETLLPLVDDDRERAIARATESVEAFAPAFAEAWIAGARRKLGLATERDDDVELTNGFLAALLSGSADHTLGFRRLAEAVLGDEQPLRDEFEDATALDAWLPTWRARIAAESRDPATVADELRLANPIYVPRNHRVEAALDAAVERADLAPFRELLAVVVRPFEERPEAKGFERPGPKDAEPYVTFCGT